MKVIKISDEAYSEVCKVSANQKTYLSDALDKIVFRKVESPGSGNHQESELQREEGKSAGYLEELFGEPGDRDNDDGAELANERNLAEEVSNLVTQVEAIRSTLEGFCQNLSQFGETQRFNIEAAVAQAFEEQASLAQLLEESQADEDDTDQHVHCGNCQQCFDLYHNYYHQGKDEILEQPGVIEAIQFFHEQQKRNEEAPGEPVAENWSVVPGVKALVEQYQTSQTIITIVDSDPPQQSSEERIMQETLASIRKSLGQLPGS